MSAGRAAYDYKDIVSAYKSVGVGKGRVVYVTGNFGSLGFYQYADKQAILQDHFNVLRELVGDSGTLIVPTHSFSLCNTDTVFDPHATPSETGPFTEFVRQQHGSVRQFHPFSSSTAIGAEAEAICTQNSRHAYGPESPFHRMVDRDALYVSVGMPMNKTISLVHHIEMVMGVPYRYAKEFVHPCLVDGAVRELEFYFYVTRRECDIVRDRNLFIMDEFKKRYKLHRSPVGRSHVEALSCLDFYRSTTRLFAKNIYCWLREPPVNRPYRI